jgi:hypothetical protein
MRFATFVALLSVACDAPAEPAADAATFVDSLIETPDGLPLQAPPPPTWIPTFEVGPVYAGEIADVLVGAIPAGAQVYLLKSEAGPGAGACHPQYPICAGLRAPMGVVSSGVAGPAGEVALQYAVPGNAVAPYWLQAAIIHPGTQTARVTAVELRVPGDMDGDFILDGQDNCVEVNNGAQIDQDADGFGLPCDCADNNAGAHPGAVEVPGNGVDDDCLGGDESAWGGSYTGDLELRSNLFPGGGCTADLELEVPVGTGSIWGVASCPVPFLGALEVQLVGTMSGPNAAQGTLSSGGQIGTWSANFTTQAGQAYVSGGGGGTLQGLPMTMTFEAVR